MGGEVIAAQPVQAKPSLRLLAAGAVLAFALATAWWLAGRPGGRSASFALLAGVSLGVFLQRARFCFFCHTRDWFRHRDPRGLLAILLAIAVGTVGYHVVLGNWLPVPEPGRFPPDAHIGPVSWALVVAGLSFGAGMAVSGSCISAHLYRLGEGSPTAPFALLGAVLGFGLGFASWNPLYSATIATAPRLWLPHHLGYGGTLVAQLVVLAALAAPLWRRLPAAATPQRPLPSTLRAALATLWEGRWPYWVGGLGVGLIGAFVIQRIQPLGVTTPLGSVAREIAGRYGLVPERLEGLDTMPGCSTVVGSSWMTAPNLLVAGLVIGALASAVASGQFAPRRPTLRHVGRGLLGGVLLGWGAMIALGCTVGTLLSGTMAGAASGWVFGAAVLAAVWAGLKIAPASRAAG